MKKILLCACMVICLAAVLTACGRKDADAPAEETGAAEEQTISGVVNWAGDYLVLLDEEESYHIFDFGEGVDAAGVEEGDRVTVTYTGVLDSEDPAPVAIAIEAGEAD